MKRSWPLCLGVAAILLAGLGYVGAKAIYREGRMAGARSVPGKALYSAWRVLILRNQAAKAEVGAVMVVGDSIVEQQNFTRLCGRPVFNAGITAATTGVVADAIPSVVKAGRPAMIVVAVGINDASHDIATPFADWRAHYRTLLSRLGDVPLVIVGVQPTEERKLGQRGHDLALVRAQNAALPALAAEVGGRFVAPLPSAVGLTIDGTHLNAEGDRRWQAAVERACPA